MSEKHYKVKDGRIFELVITILPIKKSNQNFI